MKCPLLALAVLLLGIPLSCMTLHDERSIVGIQMGRYREFRLDGAFKADDPIHLAIMRDLKGKPSILSLMHFYMSELKKSASPESEYLKRLAWLFSRGVPVDLEGHLYGWTLVLKMGEHPYGGFLNGLWSATVADVSPWSGKIFQPATQQELEEFTGNFEKRGPLPVSSGINCFVQIPDSARNRLSLEALTFWLGLRKVTRTERELGGYDWKGGLFVARRAHSVDPGHQGKEVLQLNYRWPGLKNRPPLSYLIDEVVEIADGLCLGTLLVATDHLLATFDPTRPSMDYRYENFGYFLLMKEDWKRLWEGK